MNFFVIADNISFSYEKNKKIKTLAYSKKCFKIDLLSCKELSLKNKDFANMIFKFKKQLLKVMNNII